MKSEKVCDLRVELFECHDHVEGVQRLCGRLQVLRRHIAQRQPVHTLTPLTKHDLKNKK